MASRKFQVVCIAFSHALSFQDKHTI